MSSFGRDGRDPVMVRGGANAGVPMSLEEMRRRLAEEDHRPSRLRMPRLPHKPLMVTVSVSALAFAVLALLALPY